MKHNYVLLLISVIQAAIIAGGIFYNTDLRAERDWLRTVYLEQRGLTDRATQQAEDALAIAERYAEEVEQLQREQFKARMTKYIRSVNPNAPAEEIAEAVMLAADETDIDPSWLIAKIKQESHFNPHAVSRTGCRGLTQMCRAAMRDVGLTEAEAFEVEANVLAGARYLRWQLDRTGGNIRRALARYNGNDDPLFVQRIEHHRARFVRVVG